jgi:S1-C subfamily serine protease
MGHQNAAHNSKTSVTSKYRISFFMSCCVLFPIQHATAQQSPDQQILLRSASPQLRQTLQAIYLVRCEPNASKGAAFLLDQGFLVTDLHEIEGCPDALVSVLSDTGEKAYVGHIVRDAGRDLALLVPSTSMRGGLSLSTDDDPEPGLLVTTWGFPLLYAGNAPLLSKGYIAGYRTEGDSASRLSTHIVVNAAFNPGNSGGPLLSSRNGKVLGVVQVTYNFLSPATKNIIQVMSDTPSGLQYQGTDESGKPMTRSEAQITAMVLQDFYYKTQVEIGEAISAKDINASIKEHMAELPIHPSVHK